MAILRRTVALSVLVAVLVVACQPEGRIFEVTLRTEYNRPLPVSLSDETGLVTGITQAAADPATGNEPALQADQADPNTSILTWQGGACDTNTDVVFHVLHGGYVVNVSSHEGIGTGCPAAAVPRAIRLATSHPIPVDSVTVAGG